MLRPVPPDTGAPEVVLAKDQPEYLPLPAALYQYTEHGPDALMYATRWTLTDEQRLQIAEGEDIYVTQLVFLQDRRFAPTMVLVGPQWLKVTPEDPNYASSIEVGHGG